MYCMTFSLLSCLVVGRALSQESNALKEYDLKVCQNEPSCHLTNQQNLPKNRRTFEGRDCMCDFECVEYGDCCKDSEFYGAATGSGKHYSCAPDSRMYMLTNCPTGYSDQTVVSKCLASLQPLDGPDNAVIRPATNPKRRITYGNVYCALCNDDIDDVILWNLTARCGEAPAGYFESPNRVSETSETYNQVVTKTPKTTAKPSLSLPFGLGQGLPFGIGTNTFKPSLSPPSFFRHKREQLSLDFNRHHKDLDNILENVHYDAKTKLYVSQYNGKNFICEFSNQMPRDFDLYIRKCIPNMVSSCPPNSDPETSEKCLLNTAVVYEKASKKPYKNKDCAKCNKVPEVSLTGCPQAERTAGASLFSTSDKGTSPPCSPEALRKKFCS